MPLDYHREKERAHHHRHHHPHRAIAVVVVVVVARDVNEIVIEKPPLPRESLAGKEPRARSSPRRRCTSARLISDGDEQEREGEAIVARRVYQYEDVIRGKEESARVRKDDSLGLARRGRN